jgi:hypothetical protein
MMKIRNCNQKSAMPKLHFKSTVLAVLNYSCTAFGFACVHPLRPGLAVRASGVIEDRKSISAAVSGDGVAGVLV